MAGLFTLQALIALLTLTALEVVLGIDNIIFISILAGRLPHGKRERARVIGLALAMVITAVGLVRQVPVMVLAIVIAVAVMILSVNALCAFVDRRPTIKMLALSFLLLIGVSLVAESLDFHIPKGYIYFAMAFSVSVEMLNMKVRDRQARS
ncbi:MAG: hypothetical protein A2Y56_08090 [Candidatus Aminicenantes bacterium RBG_13_63_10]|nr:MAG: hypothetical protein A2Y56_08090 [Candidatus Aminicenantes bacterium RBG_13_63_10]